MNKDDREPILPYIPVTDSFAELQGPMPEKHSIETDLDLTYLKYQYNEQHLYFLAAFYLSVTQKNFRLLKIKLPWTTVSIFKQWISDLESGKAIIENTGIEVLGKNIEIEMSYDVPEQHVVFCFGFGV